MKKFKKILFILILAGLCYYYHDEIMQAANQLPFIHQQEETTQYPDRSGYTYYFKPYQDNFTEK